MSLKNITPIGIAAVAICVATLIGGLLHSGQRGTADATPTEANIAAVPVPTAATEKPTRAARDFVGKPVAPIDIDFELIGTPRLGHPVEIVITVTPQVSMTNAALTLTAPEGLVLSSPGLTSIADTPAGTAANISLLVTALVVEVQYLSVFVEADLAGVRQARSIQIPIRLFAAPGLVPAQLKTAGGQSIRVMPAAETLR